MRHEYREGPEAAQRFEKLATAPFRVPKSTATAQKERNKISPNCP
jgi:hypothetical protein